MESPPLEIFVVVNSTFFIYVVNSVFWEYFYYVHKQIVVEIALHIARWWFVLFVFIRILYLEEFLTECSIYVSQIK